jgi:hypothetical protein
MTATTVKGQYADELLDFSNAFGPFADSESQTVLPQCFAALLRAIRLIDRRIETSYESGGIALVDHRGEPVLGNLCRGRDSVCNR